MFLSLRIEIYFILICSNKHTVSGISVKIGPYTKMPGIFASHARQGPEFQKGQSTRNNMYLIKFTCKLS